MFSEMSFTWFSIGTMLLGAVMQTHRQEGEMTEIGVWNREVYYSAEILTKVLYSFKMKSAVTEAFFFFTPFSQIALLSYFLLSPAFWV